MTILTLIGPCLFPGMLLGFGFAVYPRREALGRRFSPGGRRLWMALPGAALQVGWLLMGATLLTQRLGEFFGAAGWRVLTWCLTLDAMAVGAVLLLVAGSRPVRVEISDRRYQP